MLFVQDQYQYLVANSKNQEPILVSQFENQEFVIKLKSMVFGQKCTVLGSLTAPTDQALQLLLLLHTLNQAGASRVTLLSPYLGYQRQDNLELGLSHGLQWADAMLYAAGVKQIITIEPHNFQSLSAMKVPVIAYNAETFFEEEITYFVDLGFGFVFPDAGAQQRSRWISEKFPMAQRGSFIKKRQHDMTELELFEGRVGRKVIIYDDILDSGQTLMQICIALRQMGVEEIVIFVTHAFFHGQAWNDLWKLGVKLLFCTDSLPAAHQIDHLQIRKKSIMNVLQNSI